MGIFEEVVAYNVDQCIDRAHQFGKTYFYKKSSKKKCKSIIVKFTKFQHHTIVYQHSLLKSASNLVKDVDIILFCYADITCRLKIKWKD